MRDTTPNVRFWVYVPGTGDYVKLTLAPEQSIDYYESHATEEGWQTEAIRWFYDSERGIVVRERYSRARDCDGLFSSQDTCECPLNRLAEIMPYGEENHTFRLPLWEVADSSQRDYSAEAAGY